jgi:hypothetical protein
MTIEWTSEDGDTKRCRKLVSGLDITARDSATCRIEGNHRYEQDSCMISLQLRCKPTNVGSDLKGMGCIATRCVRNW